MTLCIATRSPFQILSYRFEESLNLIRIVAVTSFLSQKNSSKKFFKYIAILIGLFVSIFDLHFTLTLNDFYHKIFELFKIYQCQRRVLPILFDLHTYIVENYTFDL